MSSSGKPSTPQRSLLAYFSPTSSPSSSPATTRKKRARENEDAPVEGDDRGDDDTASDPANVVGSSDGASPRTERRTVTPSRRGRAAGATAVAPSPLRNQQRQPSPSTSTTSSRGRKNAKSTQPPAKRARKAARTADEEDEEEDDDEDQQREQEDDEGVVAPKHGKRTPAGSPLVAYRGTRGTPTTTRSGRSVRRLKLEDADPATNKDSGDEEDEDEDDDDPRDMDEDFDPSMHVEEEVPYENEEHSDGEAQPAKTKRGKRCVSSEAKRRTSMAIVDDEADESETVMTNPIEVMDDDALHGEGAGDVVTRNSVKELAFKRGVTRTKEEREERLKEVLSRPVLNYPHTNGSDEHTDVEASPLKRSGGRGGQIAFRERHRHWLAEANQKDAQGRSRDDPAYDPTTLSIPRKDLEGMNGFQKQYWEIKKSHWDKVIFCRNGVFWELYEKDAEIGHKVLDLKLADPGAMGMLTAGVFENTFDPYAAKLIAHGYKVVKVEQMQPNTKSSEKRNRPKDQVITRQVTRILSPGTLVDDIYIDDERAIYLLAIKEEWEATGDKPPIYGVCFVDTATGEINVGQFQDDKERTQLETLLLQIKPREILYEKEGPHTMCSPQTLQMIKRSVAQPTMTRRKPGGQFWNAATTSEFLLNATYFAGGWPPVLKRMLDDHRESVIGSQYSLSALGAVVSYLQELYLDKEILSQGRLQAYTGTTYDSPNLVLDSKTIKNLEIFENTVDGKTEGTLFKLLDHCCTPFGKRLFKRWLAIPLKRVKDIEERYNAVEDFNGTEAHSTSVKDAVMSFKGLPDLERIISRIHAGSATIQAFLNVLDAFDSVWNSITELQPLVGELRSKRLAFLLTIGKGFPDLSSYLLHFSRAFNRDQARTEGRLILRPGVDEEFDQTRQKVESIEENLQQHLVQIQEKLGMRDLAYTTVRNKEYLIEIEKTPKSAAALKHSPEFILINETKNVGRYWTTTVSSLMSDLEKARTELERCILGLFARSQQKFAENHSEWSLAVACLAELDCLHSLAIASSSLGEPVCRPEFVESDKPFFEAEDMRHPCVSPKLGSDFIPNTIQLGYPHQPLILLTGPNMGGKSTLLRETCVLAIMAQIGCFLPALSCRLSPVDRIFTRIGANDNIMAGQSTFMIELQETASILRHATSSSLVILDELGRGTATFDGYSIAYSVLEHLSKNVGCRTLFSTHYHMLTDEVISNPNIALKHMSCLIDEHRKDVTFLYKMADGVCPKSYGMNVARMAGVNEEIVTAAEKIASKFEGQLALDLESVRSLSEEAPNDDTTASMQTEEESLQDTQAELLSDEETSRVKEITSLLRDEEEKGVPGRMAAFAKLLGMWS